MTLTFMARGDGWGVGAVITNTPNVNGMVLTGLPDGILAGSQACSRLAFGQELTTEQARGRSAADAMRGHSQRGSPEWSRSQLITTGHQGSAIWNGPSCIPYSVAYTSPQSTAAAAGNLQATRDTARVAVRHWDASAVTNPVMRALDALQAGCEAGNPFGSHHVFAGDIRGPGRSGAVMLSTPDGVFVAACDFTADGDVIQQLRGEKLMEVGTVGPRSENAADEWQRLEIEQLQWRAMGDWHGALRIALEMERKVGGEIPEVMGGEVLTTLAITAIGAGDERTGTRAVRELRYGGHRNWLECLVRQPAVMKRISHPVLEEIRAARTDPLEGLSRSPSMSFCDAAAASVGADQADRPGLEHRFDQAAWALAGGTSAPAGASAPV